MANWCWSLQPVLNLFWKRKKWSMIHDIWFSFLSYNEIFKSNNEGSFPGKLLPRFSLPWKPISQVKIRFTSWNVFLLLLLHKGGSVKYFVGHVCIFFEGDTLESMKVPPISWVVCSVAAGKGGWPTHPGWVVEWIGRGKVRLSRWNIMMVWNVLRKT